MKTRYKLAALALSIFFLVFLPHNNLLNTAETAFGKNSVLSVTKTSPSRVAGLVSRDYESQKQDLLTNVQKVLSQSQSYSVEIYDLNNDQVFGLNQYQPMLAASVMKVLIATTTFQQIEKGSISLNDSLGDGTVQDQLQQLINQSNNDSWDLLNNLVGLQTEQNTADQLGLSNLKIMGNTMSTDDATKLLVQLSRGQDINSADRNLLFSWMQNTETEDRITAALPSGVTAYHKTGTLDGVVNDAAIVLHPKNPFVLTIFTEDDTGLVNQTQTLQDTTRLVYNFFDSL